MRTRVMAYNVHTTLDEKNVPERHVSMRSTAAAIVVDFCPSLESFSLWKVM